MPSSTFGTSLIRSLSACMLALSLLRPGLARGQVLPPTPALNLPSSDEARTTSCPEADGPDSDRTYPLRKAAFAAIAAKDAAAARHLMRCAIHMAPDDRIALRQEVYLDLDAGDRAAASEDIDALRALGEHDGQMEAQQGYLYAEIKDYVRARAAFHRAIASGDSALRLQSVEALRNLRGEDAGRAITFDVDSQYLNRFDDGVVDGSVHLFQRLGARSPFKAFLGVRLLRDTASRGNGPLPQIFDDNALMPGIGIAFQPRMAHYSLTAEASEAYVFYAGRNQTAALVPDLRVVAGYYNVFRPRPDRWLSERFSLRANGSVGFYSRYQHDVIAYLQPRESFDLVRQASLRLTPYFEQSLALDTNQQFYNNAVELIPGLEFSARQLPGVTFRSEYVRGFYLPFHTSSPNPYGPEYNDFRVRMAWQKSLNPGRGGD